jgi:hypothetical protein
LCWDRDCVRASDCARTVDSDCVRVCTVIVFTSPGLLYIPAGFVEGWHASLIFAMVLCLCTNVEQVNKLYKKL